ncbi:unnamed protein product [Ilex paraguariensis]|uniref:Uncharacterized protein n=1 Tax=Ilex paraguariensis TaxID=185542 RepID=A0ABC8TRD5_9AQUA
MDGSFIHYFPAFHIRDSVRNGKEIKKLPSGVPALHEWGVQNMASFGILVLCTIDLTLCLTGLLGVDLPSVPLTPYQRREGKKSIYPVDQNIIQSSCHLTRVEFVSIGCILELTLLAMSTSSLSDSAARVE